MTRVIPTKTATPAAGNLLICMRLSVAGGLTSTFADFIEKIDFAKEGKRRFSFYQLFFFSQLS
jgi:D-arabinose 1-dehydrogenase-like Zn-dependent alcohol dehydrogenase